MEASLAVDKLILATMKHKQSVCARDSIIIWICRRSCSIEWESTRVSLRPAIQRVAAIQFEDSGPKFNYGDQPDATV